jgi:hypothetical protein
MKPERVEAIYAELDVLVVELAKDPGALGPQYLQDLISRTRGFLNKTSLFLSEVHREHFVLERELVAFESAYEVSSDELLANDHRVTRLPNIDDRKAMINLILRDERITILKLKTQIRELSFIEKVIKHRHKELDNTMGAVRMQKSLMDTEVRTGAYYGDENEVSRNRGARPPVDDIDEDELAKLLGDDTLEMVAIPDAAPEPESAAESAALEPPQPVVETIPEEPKVEEPAVEEDTDISKFLEGDDFSDVLNSL